MREELSDRVVESDFGDEPVPASERQPRPSLSRVLWGLEWNRRLPVILAKDPDIALCASSYEGSFPFIRDHYRTIFHEDGTSPFSTSRLCDQKARYYRVAGDFLEIREGDRTIGLIVGTPVDWATYYIRSAAVLPEFQCKQLVKSTLRFMFDCLQAAGLERVEADTSPSNLRAVHLLTSLGFNVVGSALTDRWGAQVRFARFLDERAENIFLRQFCAGVVYQLRGGSTAQP